jgi:flagellar secretion chaperone FliS
MDLYNQQKFQAYKQASHNVDKGKQIVMLYDGVIRFVQQAKSAHASKNIAERFNLLQKAINVIMGLQGSLDIQNYPEISSSLYDYYETVYIRLNNLIKGDSEEYDSLSDDLKIMRDAWIAADDQQKMQPTIENMPPLAFGNSSISATNDFGSFAITA